MTGTGSLPHRPFGAVGTAMVTPFTADGEAVDLDAAQELAVHLVDHGQDMLVLSGTTGESPTTSDQEKTDLLVAVREAVGPEITLLAGVGTNDTRHSIHLAQQAARCGADIDGVLLVSPYYSRPGQVGVIAHTEAVADATDLPMMLYDIPGRTAVALETDTILRLAEHERIVALKDAKGELQQATFVMNQTDLAYYSGEDALNLTWLTLGAAGLVSVVGHVAPRLEADLVESVDRSDLPAARDIHRRLAPVVDAVMGIVPGVVASKAALAMQGVLPNDIVRSPLVRATDSQRLALAEALQTTTETPS
ncbi:MAG: 4-hydroxy-tetrahydrodipicolinate synthase [Brachybacterium sp.]|nr:4-hydroxy-tetrahydrodipicolinate synthase [Brachybacterium sp.]